jgi:hypothetical protein
MLVPSAKLQNERLFIETNGTSVCRRNAHLLSNIFGFGKRPDCKVKYQIIELLK